MHVCTKIEPTCMTAAEWRNYRAQRRHNPLTAYDCLGDSCMMYAMDTNRALWGDRDAEGVLFKLSILRQLEQVPGLSFTQPTAPHQMLALFFAPDDFHFARLDNGRWTEKFRQDVPRIMSTDARGAPVCHNPEYRFDRYVFMTAPVVGLSLPGDRARYTYAGRPRYTHRAQRS